MPLILNSLAVRGSPRIELITDPPWVPVAPKTTRIFWLDADMVHTDFACRRMLSYSVQNDTITFTYWKALFGNFGNGVRRWSSNNMKACRLYVQYIHIIAPPPTPKPIWKLYFTKRIIAGLCGAIFQPNFHSTIRADCRSENENGWILLRFWQIRFF